ncbi:hypothetical protein EU538_02570 [Candidatus Thorarchaeota archaeon]|jgi:hypothetical protein|nr:MAG: hypothetical protein EU538_02570 [Candidatus Thorarchaeota archaeon]
MEMASTSKSLEKYLRVFPIFGLLFYYIGGLITSLDVSDSIVYIVQVVVFSIVLLFGLFLLDWRVVILGSVLALIGTAGSLVSLIQGLVGNTLGLSMVGGAFSIVADVFFLLTIYTWMKAGPRP